MSSSSKTDQLTTAVTGFFSSVSKNAQAFALAAGALLAILGLGLFLMSRQGAKSDAARNALFLAEELMQTEMKTLAAAEAPAKVEKTAAKAKPPAPPSIETLLYKKWDVDQKLPGAVKKLQAVATEFSGTRASFEANLKLGDLYFDHGEATKSLSWYQKAVETAPAPYEKALALTALGYAYENTGKNADAISTFEQALNLGEASLKGDLLLAIARNHEASHDSVKARSTYDQILSQLPGTDYAKSAELYKANLE